MNIVVSSSSLSNLQEQEKIGSLGTKLVLRDEKSNVDWSALHMLVEVSCQVSQEEKKNMSLSSLLSKELRPKKQMSPPCVKSPQMSSPTPNFIAYSSSSHQENNIIDCSSSRRKRKLSYDCDDEKNPDDAKKKKKKKKQKKKRKYIMKMVNDVYQPPPELPEEYKQMMNGEKAELVIQKQLFMSDVNPDLNRLTLPPKQILYKEFLRPHEIDRLKPNETYLKVPFIDPCLGKEEISVSSWKLSSSNEKSLVLNSSWNYIVKKNNLAIGDLIQIWSLRDSNDRLQLALVVLKREEKCKNEVAERAENRENGISAARNGSVSNVSGDNTSACHKGRTSMRIRFKCNSNKSESTSTSNLLSQ